MNELEEIEIRKEIRSYLSTSSIFEQLAEEAAELSAAALKYARITRGENPSRTSRIDAVKNLIEELSDVMNVADVLGIKADEVIMHDKLKRWIKSIKEVKP